MRVCDLSYSHIHILTLPGYPITTESIQYGLRVGVLALPANPQLLTPQAMEVVGPAAFDCPDDVEYHAPRSLQQIEKILES